MSLRDQLLKAGLVDKKKVREVERDLKKRRKKSQARRKKKKVREAEAAAAREAAAREAAARKAEERRRAEAERAERERRRLVRNLLVTWRVPMREGPVPFFHRSPDGRHALRLRLPESVAWDLRRGLLAVAWDGPSPERAEVLLVTRHAALRLREAAPDRVLFFNETPPPDDDPAERPYGL